ncbi:probable G-protein coupled receptor No18 isoform X2 [Ptychodera flava]|uniref:probable G-protein coupled receptor No18 isoform X2 n=1 Tax=Ptychodera flava TaxID=63121 RepID=UPI00396AAFAD
MNGNMSGPEDLDLLAKFYVNDSAEGDSGSSEMNSSSVNSSTLMAADPPWQSVVTGILLSLMIVATFLGNALVILSVVLEAKLRTFNNYFFASLAAADLILALSVMPFALLVQLNGGQWYYGKQLCDVFIFLDVSCCTASILNLCAISLNRYWSVTSPLKYASKQTSARAAVMISIVWAASFLIACPPLFGWPKRNSDPLSCEHNQNYVYIIYSSFGSFYIPVLVLTVVYFKIYRISKRGAEFRRRASLGANVGSSTKLVHLSDVGHVTTKISRFTALENSPRHAPRPRTRRVEEESKILRLCKMRILNKSDPIKAAERKTAKTLALIMGAFFVCWLPFFVMYLVMPFCDSCTIHPMLEGAIVWLGYCNSTLNPVIYICCKPQFRETFKKILCCYFIGSRCGTEDKKRKLRGTVVARSHTSNNSRQRFGPLAINRQRHSTPQSISRPRVTFSQTQSTTEKSQKAVSSNSDEINQITRMGVPRATAEKDEGCLTGNHVDGNSGFHSDSGDNDSPIHSPFPRQAARGSGAARQKELDVVVSELQKLERDYYMIMSVFDSESLDRTDLEDPDVSSHLHSDVFGDVKDRDLELLLANSQSTDV